MSASTTGNRSITSTNSSSSTTSTPTGILRRTSSSMRGRPMAGGEGMLGRLQNATAPYLGSPSSRAGVHFAVPDNLPDLLLRAASKNEVNAAGDRKTLDELEGLLTHLRNARGPALVDWLQQIQLNVAILKPKMENFVLALLRIGWADQDEDVVNVYQEFIVNLVTAQGYYIKPVMKMLVCNMTGITDRAAFNDNLSASGEDNNPEKSLESVEKHVFDNTHATIKAILKVAPLAGQTALLQYTRECQPYALTPDTHSHTNYIRNILTIADYMGKGEDGGRIAVLAVLIERLVQIDAHIDKNEDPLEDETEKAQEEIEMDSMEHLNRRNPPYLAAKANLDAAMNVVFTHIKHNGTSSEAAKDDAKSRKNSQDVAAESEKSDGKASKSKKNSASKQLYQDLMKCFESHILPAHGTGHVQFALFYQISSQSCLIEQFLGWLWSKFTLPNTPQVLRQAAMGYIASFISRALCINKATLMIWLKKICAWIRAYIDQSWSSASVVSNGQAHGPFYAACQAVFYMFVFRQDEFKDSKFALEKLSKLGLQHIVTCHLNPLRFCLPTIVRNFSAVAKHFQVAYCETIIQKNARSHLPVVSGITSSLATSRKPVLLDSFFPFDPYNLKSSKHFIEPHYREYHGNIELEDEEDISSDEEEEIMGEQDDSEDDGDEVGGDEDTTKNIDDALCAKPPKRQRLSSSRSSLSTSSSVFDFGYTTSPGFKR